MVSPSGKRRFNNLLIVSQIKARRTLLDKNDIYEKSLAEKCGVLKNVKSYTKYQLKIFLALLYWGEGSKTKKNLTFTNSDHNLIKSYLKLLRASFNVDEKKISAWLHLHDYHDRQEMLTFWSNVTGIDKKRIHVYNKKNAGLRKKRDYKGVHLDKIW